MENAESWLRVRSGDGQHAQRLANGRCPSDGDRLVYLRCVAADANCSDDLPVNENRHSTLERCGIRERQCRNTAALDLFLEVATRPAIDGCRSRLADPDVDTGDLRRVHASQLDDCAGAVDDRDHNAHAPGICFRFGGRNDLACRSQRQYLLLENETLAGVRRGQRTDYRECQQQRV